MHNNLARLSADKNCIIILQKYLYKKRTKKLKSLSLDNNIHKFAISTIKEMTNKTNQLAKHGCKERNIC